MRNDDGGPHSGDSSESGGGPGSGGDSGAGDGSETKDNSGIGRRNKPNNQISQFDPNTDPVFVAAKAALRKFIARLKPAETRTTFEPLTTFGTNQDILYFYEDYLRKQEENKNCQEPKPRETLEQLEIYFQVVLTTSKADSPLNAI